jgi:hypothetical protein
MAEFHSGNNCLVQLSNYMRFIYDEKTNIVAYNLDEKGVM